MTDLIAALTLLGAPAAALFALRCTVQHQFRKERAGYPIGRSMVPAPLHKGTTNYRSAL